MIYLEIHTKDAHRAESSGKTTRTLISNPSIKIITEQRRVKSNTIADVKVIELEGSEITWNNTGTRGGEEREYKIRSLIQIDLDDLKKILKKASRAGLLPTRSKSEQKDNPSLEQ